MHVHSTVAQMKLAPCAWQSASLVHVSGGFVQMPHPAKAPGARHSSGLEQSPWPRHCPAPSEPPVPVPVELVLPELVLELVPAPVPVLPVLPVVPVLPEVTPLLPPAPPLP
jgi:hypothetical protein